MRLLLFVLAVTAALGGVPASPQNVPAKDPCKVMPAGNSAGSKNFLTFDQFDKELRIALTRQDALALSFLVRFPLRVNDNGGTISIDNAEALKAHFQEVFTPAVRKEILGEDFKNLGCMAEGMGYGLGVIWVSADDRGYAIWSVNRDAVPPFPKASPAGPVIKFVCQTDANRIVVDTDAGGALRYRAWRKPRAVTDAPDVEIAKGEGKVEGTNYCAVSTYTFKNGGSTYYVEGGLGCWGDNEPGPPKGVTGHLEVRIRDKQPIWDWCY